MKGSDRLRRLLRASMVLLGIITLGGTVLTKLFFETFEKQDITWLQALQFVVETITTVGYGDFVPATGYESPWTTLLVIALMVVGVTLIFLIGVSLITRWMDERLNPEPPRRTTNRNHLIITEYNALVEDLVANLQERGEPLVLVVEDEDRALRLHDEGFDVVQGEAQEPATLEAANIDHANGLLTADDDATNIGAILAARSLTDVPIVSLVERLAKARFPVLAGADAVVSPKVAMGRGLVDWTLAIPTPAEWPPPIHIEDGAECISELNPSVFYITEGSPVSEMLVGDVGQHTDALIVGLWRGERLQLNPDPDVEVFGTAIIAVGEEDDVNHLAQLASDGEDGNVVLVGLGDVGSEAHDRLQDAGVDVTVVDLHEQDVPNLVQGDATDLDVLREAGVDEADTLVLAIDDDDVTIQVALEARSINPGIHISARAMSDTALERFQWAGIDHPLSMPTVSARMLMQALVREGALRPPFNHVAAVRPAGHLAGDELRAANIRARTGCLVVALVADGDVRPAHGGEHLAPGTELVLLGTPRQLEAFEETFM